MSRKFISTLGTGNYLSCKYYNKDISIETRFIQEALIEMYMNNPTKDDKVVIFITEKAWQKNWCNNDDSSTGLKDILDKKYPDINVKAVKIKEGNSEEELWDTFDKILNEIEDDDNIIFDITHGFRSIPMQVLAVINYAKVIKNNVNLLGIYYGAYEARNKLTNEAPIFNVSIYNDILNWTSAANSFINYGNSDEIYDLYNEKLANGHKEIRPLEKFIRALKDFTNTISTCRGKIIKKSETKDYKKRMKRSIREAAFQVNENLSTLNSISEKDKLSIKPFERLFNKINYRLKDFDCDSNLEIGIATIKWCKKNHLIQGAYTAIDETIKTYVCNKYGLDDTLKENRDLICKSAMINMIRENRKAYIDMKITKSEDLKIYNKIKDTLPIEIAVLANKVSKLRNDINHFGFLDKSSSYVKFEDDLDNIINEFLSILDKYNNKDFI